MQSENLGRWVAAIANFGILVGLVLVAVQISQNSSLARTSLVNEGNIASNQMWGNLMGENPGDVIARASECPDSMTYSDFMAMDAFLFSNLNMLYRDYQLAQEGLCEEADWKTSVDTYAHWYLGNEFGRAWWDLEARHFFDVEFSRHVDTQLLKEGRDSSSHWKSIKTRIASDASGDNHNSPYCG